MKQSIVLVLAALIAVTVSACGARDSAEDQRKPVVDAVAAPDDKAVQGAVDATVDSLPMPSVELSYYVSDSDMGELTELKLEVKDDGKGLHARAIEMLASDPGEGKVSLWKGASFNRVELQDGVLTVDVSIPAEARLGAPGEALALDALTRTAFQFDDVEALNILVDGEETDSLMGHELLEHPIHRS